jgi:hypothetical protein
MFDQAVKFEDVNAETIAMEFFEFEDVDADTLAMEHFEDMRVELGVDSVWSMWDFGTKGLDFEVFVKKMRKVTYEFVRADATVEELNADLRDGGKRSMVQVSSWAINGTIKSLWLAADSCIKQSGTHHRYIEDFEFGEDGTLELVTGS